MTTTQTPQTTTWTKLRSGEWGVRGPADEVKQHAAITVTKRDGTTKTAMVLRVVWTDGKTAIASVEPDHPRHRHSTHGECIECGEHGPIGRPCRSCHEGIYA